MDHRQDLIDTIIDALDLPVAEDTVTHVGIVLDALAIYGEKDRKYGSAWKRLGALNNLTRMSTKVERLLEMYWHQGDWRAPSAIVAALDLDDAYDLINYDAFFVAQAKKGEWTRG